MPTPPELNEEVEPGEDYIQRRDALAARNREKHGHEDWYSWHIENWGTKWDISNDGFEPEASEDGKSVFLAFDTAWSPPIMWYHEMVDEHGFDVQATYFEPGMAFVGRYTTDDLDDCYDYSGQDAEWISENIPEELVEEYDILSWIEEEDILDDDSEESDATEDDEDK